MSYTSVQTRDLINLPNPQLGPHDKGLTHTHAHAEAVEDFHSEGWQTLLKPYAPDLSCSPEVLCA